MLNQHLNPYKGQTQYIVTPFYPIVVVDQLASMVSVSPMTLRGSLLEHDIEPADKLTSYLQTSNLTLRQAYVAHSVLPEEFISELTAVAFAVKTVLKTYVDKDLAQFESSVSFSSFVLRGALVNHEVSDQHAFDTTLGMGSWNLQHVFKSTSVVDAFDSSLVASSMELVNLLKQAQSQDSLETSLGFSGWTLEALVGPEPDPTYTRTPARWDPSFNTQFTYTDSYESGYSGHYVWGSARSTFSTSEGKWVVEFYAYSGFAMAGVLRSDAPSSAWVGSSVNSCALYLVNTSYPSYDGALYYNNNLLMNFTAAPAGSPVLMLLDLDNNEVKYVVNGVVSPAVPFSLPRSEGQTYHVAWYSGASASSYCSCSFGRVKHFNDLIEGYQGIFGPVSQRFEYWQDTELMISANEPSAGVGVVSSFIRDVSKKHRRVIPFGPSFPIIQNQNNLTAYRLATGANSSTTGGFYLDMAQDFRTGVGDFTLEVVAKFDSSVTTSDSKILFTVGRYSVGTGIKGYGLWVAKLNSTTARVCLWELRGDSTGGYSLIQTDVALSTVADQFFHAAIRRQNAGGLELLLNKVSVGVTSWTPDLDNLSLVRFGGSNAWSASGDWPLNPAYNFQGWLHCVRFVKRALDTDDMLVIGQEAPAVDSAFVALSSEVTTDYLGEVYYPHADKIVSKLEFDHRENSSTSFIDRKGLTWTKQGSSPTLTKMGRLFGNGCAYFAGNGNLYCSSVEAFKTRMRPFTISVCINPDDGSNNVARAVLGHWVVSNSQTYGIIITTDYAVQLRVGASTWTSAASMVYPNTYNHLVLTRDDTGAFRVFVQGKTVIATAPDPTDINAELSFYLGYLNIDGHSYFLGRMDDFLFADDSCAYTLDFDIDQKPYSLEMAPTPPTPVAPLLLVDPIGAGSSELLVE